MIKRVLARVVVVTVMLSSLAAGAWAQPPQGVIASGSVAAAVADRGSRLSVAGAFGYRFNPIVGMGVELTWVRSQLRRETFASPFVIASGRPGRDMLFFTTNVHIEIPTTSKRILPYAIGGGGVASVTTRYDIEILPAQDVTSLLSGTGLNVTFPTIAPRIETSATDLALTLGGGISVLATDHFSIDADLRTFYTRGASTGSVGRFGAGASYRF